MIFLACELNDHHTEGHCGVLAKKRACHVLYVSYSPHVLLLVDRLILASYEIFS